MDINLDIKPNGYYSGLRSEMLSFVPLNVDKILEIGCGNGVFASQLKTERRVEVWGIELSRDAAEEAAIKLDRVIVGNVETDAIDLPNNYFDCVIFNDVLEHLRDPWAVLSKFRSVLVEDGYVVASIPNIRYFPIFKKFLLDKEWEYVDTGVLDKTHLRFFTEKSISHLFNVCGFSIVTIHGINGIEFPWKFKLFNLLSGRRFEDMKYQQFACVGRKLLSCSL